MDPITASILLNAGGLAAQHFMGAGRPKYEIPQSAREALAQARILQADKYMPGEQKAIERAGVSSANTVRAAQESGNALESLASIQGQYDRTTQDILARSEADQQRDTERLASQLANMAQYEDQAYQMNEFAPYAERQQETRDILGALATNVGNEMQHQQLMQLLGTQGVQVRGAENEAAEGIQPPSEEVGEYRVPTPQLLSQPPLSSVTSDGGRLPQLDYSVTTNAEAGATDYDQIRRLLELLKKQQSPYPY